MTKDEQLRVENYCANMTEAQGNYDELEKHTQKLNDVWSLIQEEQEKKKFMNLLALGYGGADYIGSTILGPSTGYILGPTFFTDISGRLDVTRIERIEQNLDDQLNGLESRMEEKMNNVLTVIESEKQMHGWFEEIQDDAEEYQVIVQDNIVEYYEEIKDDLSDYCRTLLEKKKLAEKEDYSSGLEDKEKNSSVYKIPKLKPPGVE